jgi:plasmid stabilization system protein ParE
MSYDVGWLPDAERELARIWFTASDRNAVTRAANWIDSQLKTDPANEGESRPNGRRILLVAPLGVIFRVVEADRRVVIAHVWQFRSPD